MLWLSDDADCRGSRWQNAMGAQVGVGRTLGRSGEIVDGERQGDGALRARIGNAPIVLARNIIGEAAGYVEPIVIPDARLVGICWKDAVRVL